MPIFTRRRLCSMLSELSDHLSLDKSRDLIKRLEHRDTKTALAGEAELAVLWAISRVAHMVPEPVLPGSTSRPEAASDDLFRSGPAVIEVRALSDDSFSGKEAMNRTANIVAGYADQLRKGAGKHLDFEFHERSYWTNRFCRERCVDPAFQLNTQIREQLRQWITAPDWPHPTRICITHGKTEMIVSWKKSVPRLFRTFCSMPAVAYDLEDNPIYKALRKKSAQVKGAAAGTLRCVVLVDAGCSLLMRLRTMGTVHEIGGEDIIRHAIAKLSIDVILVFSPHRRNSFGLFGESELLWKVTCFDRRESVPNGEYDQIGKMAARLPRPRLEGYQARALHRQGSFERTWHLPTTITTTLIGGKMTIRLSAGLLHEYLAGRIDAEKFRKKAFGDEKNFFEMELVRGSSIRQTQFESGGIDADDDYVIFDLDVDSQKIAKTQASSPSDGDANS